MCASRAADPQPLKVTTTPPGPAALPALPLELLELIAAALPLRDRVSLTSCCRGLWARGDVVASAALWGNMTFTQQQLAQLTRKQGSLAAWLLRRRGACRRLRLSFGVGGSGSLTLLGSLEGGSVRALEVSSNPPIESVKSAFQPLQNLKTLTRLELRGGCLITIPEGISALESLEVLDLSRNSQLGDELVPRWEPLLRLSRLRRLDLSGCGLKRLPPQFVALRQLEALDLNTNSFGRGGGGGGGQEAALHPLRHLLALTYLNLRWCGLSGAPSHLSLLHNLRSLDLSRNIALGEGGELGLHPLRFLQKLTSLDLSYCSLDSLPPQLPCLRTLAVLSLAGNLSLGEEVAEADLLPLEQLAGLTQLDLSRCNVPAALFDRLRAMSQAGACVQF